MKTGACHKRIIFFCGSPFQRPVNNFPFNDSELLQKYFFNYSVPKIILRLKLISEVSEKTRNLEIELPDCLLNTNPESQEIVNNFLKRKSEANG